MTSTQSGHGARLIASVLLSPLDSLDLFADQPFGDVEHGLAHGLIAQAGDHAGGRSRPPSGRSRSARRGQRRRRDRLALFGGQQRRERFGERRHAAPRDRQPPAAPRTRAERGMRRATRARPRPAPAVRHRRAAAGARQTRAPEAAARRDGRAWPARARATARRDRQLARAARVSSDRRSDRDPSRDGSSRASGRRGA